MSSSIVSTAKAGRFRNAVSYWRLAFSRAENLKAVRVTAGGFFLTHANDRTVMNSHCCICLALWLVPDAPDKSHDGLIRLERREVQLRASHHLAFVGLSEVFRLNRDPEFKLLAPDPTSDNGAALAKRFAAPDCSSRNLIRGCPCVNAWSCC